MAHGMLESHTSASLEDFEHNDRPSPVLRYPSERSGFLREDSSEAGGGDSNSDGPWSPQQADARWRTGIGLGASSAIAGSGWYRHQPYLQGSALPRSSGRSSRSREPSNGLGDMAEADEEEDPTLLPANIPLPRGSLSPTKEMSASPAKDQPTTSPEPEKPAGEFGQDFDKEESPAGSGSGLGNYIRFAIRAEVQQRSAPLEWAVGWLQRRAGRNPVTLVSVVITVVGYVVFSLLTKTPIDSPSPDLVKLAGLAKSVEPLMYYSERGVQYNTELQETGVAIWDLGESLRVANMSSAPTICRELDELAESLAGLSEQLQEYLSAVDGDVDNVLLTMEWARRELAALNAAEPSALASAVSNVHDVFNYLGWLENTRTGRPTVAGRTVIYLFGRTPAQRTRQALQSTFDEFLAVLEDSLDAQLTRTAGLFVFFRKIDAQFKNLQRFTVRELGEQERAEEELLASLWQRVVGSGAARLRKFERNRRILHAVRGRTVANKNLLVDHETKLRALKESLEALRRRLVGPLLRGAAGSSLASLEDQIRGIDDSHAYLRSVRQAQKAKVMEQIYGAGNRARNLEIDGYA